MSTLGLFKKSSQKRQKEIELNFLMKMALDKVAFLPFAYLMDLWRWRVLDGTYPHRDWNCAWWDLRFESSHLMLYIFFINMTKKGMLSFLLKDSYDDFH